MSQDLFLQARPFPDQHWFEKLRPFAHKLLRLPGWSWLRPLAAKAAAVAVPAGQISFQAGPTCSHQANSSHFTVLSANLYHDWPRHRRLRQRLEAVAQLIETEAADIVLLQEVARTPHFRSDEWLADRLGMAYVYARANGHQAAIGFEEGLAIYSRYPLSLPVLTELGRERNPFTRRLGLGAQVDLPDGRLAVFSTHLGLTPAKNALQLAHLRDWIRGIAGMGAAVIGGDFNAHETKPQIVQTSQSWLDAFRHLHPQADGTTHEIRWPWGRVRRRRLDYLFLHGERPCWQVLDTRHVDAPGGPHSDHRAVVAKLKMAC